MKLKILAILLLLLMVNSPAHAQGDTQPVVYAVLFYSPTCPHCQEVITNGLPPIQEAFGDQLEIVFINVQVEGGSAFYREACDVYEIPDPVCGPVPMMVVGDRYLIGSVQIPEELPGIVHDGLASGGLPFPALPRLQQAYEAFLAETDSGTSAESTETPSSSLSTVAIEENQTWQDKFNTDVTGNSLAVVVLSLLIAGLVLQFLPLQYSQRNHTSANWISEKYGWPITTIAAIVPVFMAFMLVLEEGAISSVTLLALVVMVLLVAVLAAIGRAQRTSLPTWAIPTLIVAGLLVAGYMVYVEVGDNKAVCGAVGDCNAVQQSEYAELFGILPVGVLGILGYMVMLGAWLLSVRSNENMADAGHSLLLVFTLFGVIFSIYLTFLEPFVIGASCGWCLTSAAIMLLLVLLEAPHGWQALHKRVLNPP